LAYAHQRSRDAQSPCVLNGANGAVTEIEGGNLGLDIRGGSPFFTPHEDSALAAITSSGYVTATRGTNNDFRMFVWERRPDEDGSGYDRYLVGKNDLDLGPNANGVLLAAPVITDSWG
jgi:hypothetical protein